MGNVYRYTIFSTFSFISIFFFINTHEYAKNKNLHISILNEKNYVWVKLGTKFGYLG